MIAQFLNSKCMVVAGGMLISSVFQSLSFSCLNGWKLCFTWKLFPIKCEDHCKGIFS